MVQEPYAWRQEKLLPLEQVMERYDFFRRKNADSHRDRSVAFSERCKLWIVGSASVSKSEGIRRRETSSQRDRHVQAACLRQRNLANARTDPEHRQPDAGIQTGGIEIFFDPPRSNRSSDGRACRTNQLQLSDSCSDPVEGREEIADDKYAFRVPVVSWGQ
ncbi:hypothetical protein B0H19DRAFT_1232833 [Mycena capillaripes]|nr:hypothetical protein B0H19DRAFT_1232833 [Mycena capillaripes]